MMRFVASPLWLHDVSNPRPVRSNAQKRWNGHRETRPGLRLSGIIRQLEKIFHSDLLDVDVCYVLIRVLFLAHANAT